MAFHRPWPSVPRSVALRLLAMGFFGVFAYNICFFTGLKTVPAGRASLTAAMQPSVVFIASALIWGEVVNRWKIAGLTLSLSGAVLVLSGGDVLRLFRSGLNSGDLWILGCMLSWVTYTLFSRTIAGRVPFVASTAYSTWIGTALLLVTALFQPVPSLDWSLPVWISAFFLGILGTTLAFMWYLQAIAHIGAPRASIFINLVPVFGVLSNAIFLGEMILWTTILGGAIVLTGVRLLNHQPKQPPASEV